MVARIVRATRLEQDGSLDREKLSGYILDLCYASVCHHLRSSPWTSPLLHFVARRGISLKDTRFYEGPEHSQTLAAIAFGCRLLVLYRLSRKDYDDTRSESGSLYSSLQEIHREYLHDRADAPMGEILSLLAYAMAIAKSSTSRSTIVWGTEEYADTLFYKGDPVSSSGVVELAKGVLAKAKTMLNTELLLGAMEKLEPNALELHKLKDDTTTKGNGLSFLSDPRNITTLRPAQRSLLTLVLSQNNIGAHLCTGTDGNVIIWHHAAIDGYMRHIQEFLRLLAILVNITGGQPARGTELVTLRHTNSPTTLRNIFIQQGEIMVIADYFKTRAQFQRNRPVVRFLPSAVGNLLVNYLVRVLPFAKFLYHKKFTTPPEALDNFIFVNLARDKNEEPDIISRALKEETRATWGWKAGLSAYRQIAISWNRRIQSQRGTMGIYDDDDDESDTEEDLNDIQAGHTSRIARAHYGVRGDILHELTPELISQYKAVSTQWHKFLGLTAGEHRTKPREQTTITISSSPPPGIPVDTPRHRNLKRFPSIIQQEDVPSPQARPKRLKLDGQWENLANRPAEAALIGLRRVLGPNAQFRSSFQEECLVEVIQAKPSVILVVLPTGAGKSMLFLAPAALPDARVTVVIAPYAALKANLFAKAHESGIRCAMFTPKLEEAVPLVFASAEHLTVNGGLMHYLRVMTEKGQLQRIVVDECHVVLTEMEYRGTALGRYQRLADFQCQLLLLTATLPPSDENTMWVRYGISSESALVRRFPTRRSNLRYQVIPLGTHSSGDNRQELFAAGLVDVIKNHAILQPDERGIIFCSLIDDVIDYRRELCKSGCLGYTPEIYHGKLTSEERSRNLHKWLTQPGWILATKGLGAGVDFPKLKHVVHMGYSRGDDAIEYAQQSGRAGRDNNNPQGFSFFLCLDSGGPRLDLSVTPKDGKEALLHFLYTQGCRRKVLHGYLDGDSRPCLQGEIPCDNCGEAIGTKKALIPDDSGDLPSVTQLFNMTRTSQPGIPPSTSYSEENEGDLFWGDIVTPPIRTWGPNDNTGMNALREL